MLVCPGCGGRNAPDLDVCPFCHRRLGGQANGSRALHLRRPAMILATLVLVAVIVSVALLLLGRSSFFV